MPEVLDEEIAKTSFNIRSMTTLLDGGEDWTQKKELMYQLIERDAILMKPRYFDLTSAENREKTMEQVRRANDIRNMLKRSGDLDLVKAFDIVMDSYDRSYGMRSYVHNVLFKETIWGQGTEEQYKKYEKEIEDMSVLGCFGMTELGHSSFLRGLETTATYDQKRNEFIIHTPTLLGTKWWIGMSGQVATHACVLCKLVVNGKSKGLHWFVVKLRNNKTGELMPGVSCGHIGEKMGRSGLDNGWMQFSHVRVPFDSMLQKWGKLTRDAKYMPPENMTISYAPLIGERIVGLMAIFDNVAQAVTIAIRYGISRIQGPNNEKIIDYQTHQNILMPILATTYCINFIQQKVIHSWQATQNSYQRPGGKISDAYQSIQDHHAIAAGLKTHVGWWGMESLELCRRCMAGHGYSAYNAIAGLIGDYGVITTGGGDNLVLAQQHVQYLLSRLRKVVSGASINGTMVSYLMDATNDEFMSNTLVEKMKSDHDDEGKFEKLFLNNTSALQNAFKWLSIKLLTNLGQSLASNLSGKVSSQLEAWNNHLVEAVECSKVNTIYFMLSTFVEGVANPKMDPNLKPVLHNLCHLFALSNVQQRMADFLEQGYLDTKHAKLVRNKIIQLNAQVRKDAAGLVDAFNFPDWLIKAPLGAKNVRDIYEKYFEVVTSAPDGIGKAPYWNKIVKSMVHNSKL